MSDNESPTPPAAMPYDLEVLVVELNAEVKWRAERAMGLSQGMRNLHLETVQLKAQLKATDQELAETIKKNDTTLQEMNVLFDKISELEAENTILKHQLEVLSAPEAEASNG